MVGDPIVTSKGYQVNLQRINYPSIVGEDIQQAVVDVEFQANERLRIGVRWFQSLKYSNGEINEKSWLMTAVFVSARIHRFYGTWQKTICP